MGLILAIDFGSTYTKAVAVDIEEEQLIGVSQSASTVDTDITIGLNRALRILRERIRPKDFNVERILACSSAAGGLRIVVAGLIKALTTKAAKEAALGAGAKLVGVYANGLSRNELDHITETAPDLILLSGGTDGGNDEIILHNAEVLAESQISCPIIVAGNKLVAHKCRSVLHEAGKAVVVVDNVLPELDRLNVESARSAIRDIFMRRITYAKGLDKARAIVGDIIMPTPMAVLQGVSLLADGTEVEGGLGELVAIDIGGATTDVYSIGSGMPSQPGVMVKGIPEPYGKRTVEGDLGIRYNAKTVLDSAGKNQLIKNMPIFHNTSRKFLNLERTVDDLSENISAVPQDRNGLLVDIGLASTAAEIAMQRHAGNITECYFPSGKALIQKGKDLRNVKIMIGTGGIFAYGQSGEWILRKGCYSPEVPDSLRPIKPQFYVDERYILFAVGLLAKDYPLCALRMMKTHLKKLEG